MVEEVCTEDVGERTARGIQMTPEQRETSRLNMANRLNRVTRKREVGEEAEERER